MAASPIEDAGGQCSALFPAGHAVTTGQPPSARECLAAHRGFYLVGAAGSFPIQRRVTLIGSGPAVDVRLPSPRVSAFHAELELTSGTLVVRDIGPTRHGTYVNGRAVLEAVLDRGDELQIGDQRMAVGATGQHLRTATHRSPPGRTPTGLTTRQREALTRLRAARDAGAHPRTWTRRAANDLGVSVPAVRKMLRAIAEGVGVPAGPGLPHRVLAAAQAQRILRPYA